MWRVALRYRPDVLPAPYWQIAQCWDLHGQSAIRPIKVERKNPKRKRLIMLSIIPIAKGTMLNPRRILEVTLACMSEAEKIRLVREGLA